MKTTQLLTLGALCALTLVSCSKSDQNTPDTKSPYIHATAEVEGSTTKAVTTGSDVISDLTFVRKEDAQGALTNYDFSGSAVITGSRAADGKITFSPTLNYDLAGDKTSYIMGYTSTGGTLTDNVFTWTLNGATDVLVTTFWNAGCYSNPKSTGMIFQHQTARIQVICQAEAGSALSVVQAMWGNIESIKFVNAKPELAFNYADNTVTATGTAADFTLLNADSYATGAFTSVAIPENRSTAVTASAMLAPVASTSISLKVKTTELTEKTIPITLNGNFERAKIHKVTLTFKANGKDIEASASTIEGWSDGSTGSNDVTEPTA